MRRIPRTLVIPGLGFVLVLGIALGVDSSVAGSPAARLHGRVTGYLRALGDGDVREAARYREDGDPRYEVRRTEALRGWRWFVESLQIRDGGREARVRVGWLRDDDRVLHQEEQLWRRSGPAGDWGFWSLEGITGPGRR